MSLGLFVSKNSHILDKKHKDYTLAITHETNLLSLSAISIFMIGPLNKNKISMNHQFIKAYCIENNIEIWPHGSYTSVGIWKVDHDNRHENKSKEMIRNIKDHLVVGKQLGAKGISFHLNRRTADDAASTLEVLSDCKEINNVRKNPGELPYLLIEMIASKSDDELTYETPEKLNHLVETLSSNEKITLKWAINLDTCHQYASGISYKEPNSWNHWISELSEVTRNSIKLIHLNGALGSNFGTGKDLHQIPLAKSDAIWGSLVSSETREYLESIDEKELLSGESDINLYDSLSKKEKTAIQNSSLNEIVQWCKINEVAMIMEIKKDRGGFKEIKFAVDTVNALLKL
ncbi:MAG: TIM barrel protein [Cetobacterium sp.]